MSRLTCKRGIIGVLITLSLFMPAFVHAQESINVPQTIEDTLHQMSDLAGVIFVGEVTAIRHKAGEQGASGIVEVDFRIDQAVRGCTSGSTYTLREWSGLWEGGDERYRLGQRLLMMLYSPGPTGISSPVAGMNGAIPVRPETSLALSSAAASPLIADLRWLAARVLRTIPYSDPSTIQVTAATTPDNSPQNATGAMQQTSLSVVVEMLSSWRQAIP